jgi:hypothetical protein
MRIPLLFLAIFIAVTSMDKVNAQEHLVDLQNIEFLPRAAEVQSSFGVSRNADRPPFRYIIDTLQIPFFDDFSKYKIKKYHAQKSDPNISLKVLHLFTVNGEHPVTLDLLFDTTFNFTKHITGPDTKTANPPLYITFYDSVGIPTVRDTGWLNISTIFNESTSLVNYDTIQAETTLINTFDTIYVVADDRSLWVTPADESRRGGAFINNTLAKNILTQGVATFDGTDAIGVPYDLSSETSYGAADTLESKPLYLDSEMENIFLTFFYQSGGYGNEPNEEDSLVLEFFDVLNNDWDNVWSRAGGLNATDEWSSQVWIRIDGPNYQAPGFKFRFRNYATLSANFDQWHIDYIHVNQDRDSTLGDTLVDVAFISQLSSFTGLYSMVPYTHYLSSPTVLQSATVETKIRNLGVDPVNLAGINYKISDSEGNFISQFNGGINPQLNPLSVTNVVFAQPTTQIFPDVSKVTETFNIRTTFAITGFNDRFVNDTIDSKQVFGSYYAYDDGTAEKAYGLTGAGIELAYEYNAVMGDSLRAILINFPRTLDGDAEELEIEIRVWEDTSSAPIYVSSFIENPRYTYVNEFARYELEEAVYVSGKFYIGFRQLNPDKIYMGYDVNNKSNDHLFYRIGETWFTSAIEGSLMMRADFGDGSDPLGVAVKEPDDAEFRIYPNPANQSIHIDGRNENFEAAIYSINGSLVDRWNGSENQSKDVSQLNGGFYMVQIVGTDSKKTSTAKLIIAR